MPQIPVLAVVGPTAAGKSVLAMHIAAHLPVEIICMDSMQIYRHMDIGTAKPTPEERRIVPHHMVNIVEPTAAFSVSAYGERAKADIKAVWCRGRLPMLVGGTGLYLRTLSASLTLGSVAGDALVRERLHHQAALPEGKQQLHDRLGQVDPVSAQRLHPNDLTRVIRALEVYEITGKPISSQGQEEDGQGSPFSFCMLGATLERENLYGRINRRVEEMLERGLLGEVEALLQRGVPKDAQAMQGIGYKELVPVLEGALPLDAATDLMKRNTRRYAKRQWTWFRGEESIHWLDMQEEKEAFQEGLRMAEAFGEAQMRKGAKP